MLPYKHTQIGCVSIGASAAATLIALGALFRKPHPIGLAIALAVPVIGGLFSTLTVEVDEERLAFAFGPGVLRKTVPIVEIESAGVVVNPWWYGWGIRLTPEGWLYNVSGLLAVEIRRTDGSRFRLGSDEPDALLAAIEEALARRR